MESIVTNSRRPDITFFRDGRIDITSPIAKRLGLSDGDVVGIGFFNQEYYIYIRHKKDDVVGRHKGQCFASKKNSNNFRVHCKELCAHFFSIPELKGEKICLAAGEPTILDNKIIIPIITKRNLYDETRS